MIAMDLDSQSHMANPSNMRDVWIVVFHAWEKLFAVTAFVTYLLDDKFLLLRF
jgi:hypothetical protein